MTKPRKQPHRELYGILGSYAEAGKEMAAWNALFAKQGIDAWMSKYPTTEQTIPERLSEMLHFDRRGYIVSPALQKAVTRYVDRMESDAITFGKANTILNEHGVLVGALLSEVERKEKWLSV